MKSLIITRIIIINLAMFLFIGIIQIQAQTSKTVKVNSTTENISETQKEAIENIVRDYLLKNPVIIREAMKALQLQEEKEKQELTANNLKSLSKEIFSDPTSPTTGNPNADISIVAFFDYNCGHCKNSLPGLNEVLKKDPSLRIIYKEFPILGSQSQLGAQAALAAHQQGKYVEFHNALIVAEEINEEVIKDISEKLGLNYEALKKDMSDEKINNSLTNNYNLATALGINGTPAYIVGEQIVPGAIDAESLTRIVAIERTKPGVKATSVKEKLASQK